MKPTSSLSFVLCSILCFVGLTGAKSCGQVKKTDGSPIVVKNGKKAGGGCVRGRIVNEKGKGFIGVYISTKPATSLMVTDSFGNFEICHARKVINKDTGETAKVGLPHAPYQLVIKKEGYHSRPVNFSYKGKSMRLRKVLLVEKSKPLPEVQITKSTNNDDKKKDGGTMTKPPTGEH